MIVAIRLTKRKKVRSNRANLRDIKKICKNSLYKTSREERQLSLYYYCYRNYLRRRMRDERTENVTHRSIYIYIFSHTNDKIKRSSDDDFTRELWIVSRSLPGNVFFFAHEIKKKKQNTDITGDINIANARTNFSYLATITASLALSLFLILSVCLSFSQRSLRQYAVITSSARTYHAII